MTDRFDIVPIRIDYEGAVVVLVIVRTQARPAIVRAAGRHGRGVECVNICTGRGLEGVMPTGARLRIFGQPEIRLALAIAADPEPTGIFSGDLGDHRIAQRGKGGVIEGPGPVPVRDENSDMIKHGSLSSLDA